MQTYVRNLVELWSQKLDSPILEIGSKPAPGQENIADLRSFFPNKEYIGMDLTEGKGVDIIGNACFEIPTKKKFKTVLCLETLEHIQYPWLLMENIDEVLEPGGKIIITTHFAFMHHEFPHDYWRYTLDGLKTLLSWGFKKFNVLEEGYSDGGKMPANVRIVAEKVVW